MAAPMPSGSEMSRVMKIIMSVDTNAGASVTRALLLSPNKKVKLRCGIPRTQMNTIMNSNTAATIAARAMLTYLSIVCGTPHCL